MMKPNTQKLYELTVLANDIFIENQSQISTSVGLMNQVLRNKGIDADAVMVDAIASKNRIIFILLDSAPTTVGIGLGNTTQDNINFISQLLLNELTPEIIAKLLFKHLE